MAINVRRRYKLSAKKKEIVEAWLHREVNQTEAADEFDVRRQNFPGIVATIFREMVSENTELAKVFSKIFKDY